MSIKVNINKLMLATIGKILPLHRHPGGGVLPIVSAFSLLRELLKV